MILLTDQSFLQRNAIKHQLHLRRMITTSVFIAIALILRTTATGYITLFGAQGARVGIHGAFVMLPAILFGPWYGAAAYGLVDLLGHIIRPMGAWLWWMTLVMTVGGYVLGWVWRLIRGRSPRSTRAVVVIMTLAFLAFGALSMMQLRLDGVTRNFYDDIYDTTAVDTSEMYFISRLVISRTQNLVDYPVPEDPSLRRAVVALPNRIDETVFAPLAAGVFGLVLLGVDLLLSKGLKKDTAHRGKIMPVVITIILVSLLINTANSALFWVTNWLGWRSLPFMYIWLPRAVTSFLVSVVNTFIVVLLMGVCYRQSHMKKMIDTDSR